MESHDVDGDVTCHLCQGGWHGLPRQSCPGGWASEEESAAYRKSAANPANAGAGPSLDWTGYLSRLWATFQASREE